MSQQITGHLDGLSLGPEVKFEADEDYQAIALNVKIGVMHAAVVAAPTWRE